MRLHHFNLYEMITEIQKTKISEAVNKQLPNYPSAAKMAIVLGINQAQLSRIKNGDTTQVLADGKWISVARRLGIEIGNHVELKPAKTPVFSNITKQLTACQQYSLSGLLCDMADIGKTYAAKWYVKNHRDAIYIDCSQVKTKQRLVREIAKEFGMEHNHRYNDVYADLVYYLRGNVSQPLIVLDEAGDLDYPAFLELKALWNATEHSCGWYMMGADGLREKIERNRSRRKVGYDEIFSRFGSRFQKFTPDGGEARKDFIRQHVYQIGRENGVDNVQQLYANTGGSLRRIFIEIQKLKAVGND